LSGYDFHNHSAKIGKTHQKQKWGIFKLEMPRFFISSKTQRRRQPKHSGSYSNGIVVLCCVENETIGGTK
jgi:hypothetical protein